MCIGRPLYTEKTKRVFMQLPEQRYLAKKLGISVKSVQKYDKVALIAYCEQKLKGNVIGELVNLLRPRKHFQELGE